MVDELEHGGEPGADPVVEEGRTESGTVVEELVPGVEEPAGDDFPALEDELKEAEKAPEPPKEEKPPWWKGINVPGVDSEEKAIAWAVSGQEGIKRAYDENARLKRELEGFKKPAEDPKGDPEWDEMLLKHTKKDAAGNVVKTDYSAAMREYAENQSKKTIQQMNFENQMRTEVVKSTAEIDDLANKGIIPEYIPSEVDKEGKVTKQGSEFANKVEGFLGWSQREFSRVPFHLHPHREFIAMVFAVGMGEIEKNKEQMGHKVAEMAKATGASRSVPTSTSGSKDPLTMTDKEVLEEADRLAGLT